MDFKKLHSSQSTSFSASLFVFPLPSALSVSKLEVESDVDPS
jgi:hypothetical protein